MKRPKIDTSGTERAQAAIAEAQRVANNLRQNFSTNLQTENLTQVSAGGGAAEMMGADSTRRKRSGSGLSSQLGIEL
jgi:hypothetical protein